jgi:hypothetical protein
MADSTWLAGPRDAEKAAICVAVIEGYTTLHPTVLIENIGIES